jgi:glucose-1-phosphate thymidylyltransferase
MRTFILAGGFATRLWPLTEHRAKPLLPLVGKPILTHIVEKLPADFHVTVSTNAAFEEDFDEWQEKFGRPVTVYIESALHDDAKLGALRAVADWVTREKIDEDVLLLTGDNYLGFDMATFLAAYRPGTPLLAAYDIGDLDRAKKFGTVVLGPDGTSVAAFEEKPAEPKSTFISTGCSVIPAGLLPVLVGYAKDHADNIGGIFEEFLRRTIAVDAFTFADPWFDIGSFEAYLEATKLLVGDNVVKDDASRFDGCERTGSVVLGAGSDAIRSTLTDTVVFEGCFIEDCVLENCIIDNRCTLRGVELSGKMLRADTTLILPR